MAEVRRIPAGNARRHVESGAILVCAYEDEAKCDAMTLPGAIPLRGLERRAAGLPREQELIFYCG